MVINHPVDGCLRYEFSFFCYGIRTLTLRVWQLRELVSVFAKGELRRQDLLHLLTSQLVGEACGRSGWHIS